MTCASGLCEIRPFPPPPPFFFFFFLTCAIFTCRLSGRLPALVVVATSGVRQGQVIMQLDLSPLQLARWRWALLVILVKKANSTSPHCARWSWLCIDSHFRPRRKELRPADGDHCEEMKETGDSVATVGSVAPSTSPTREVRHK